jgi:hypothetical protein
MFMWVALLAGLGWLALVEAVHQTSKAPSGELLARIDRGLRYGVAALLVIAAFAVTDWPVWLRIKLALFAGVIGCGVLIRFALIRHFAVWRSMVTNGPTSDDEGQVQAIYRKATGILFILWALVAAITALAIFKPV